MLLNKIESNSINPDEVKLILEEDGRGTQELSAEDCFKMLSRFLGSTYPQCHEAVLDLLFNHIATMFDKEKIRLEILSREILQEAIIMNNIPVVERLINMIGAADYKDPLKSPLVTAIVWSRMEIVEVLLGSEFSPDLLFGLHYDEYRDSIPMTAKKFVNQLLEDEMTDTDKYVWKMVISYLEPKAVISSRLLSCLMCEKMIGSKMLHNLELLGVDFTTLISSSSVEVKVCMRQALTTDDLGMVQFLIGHGFDVDATFTNLEGETTTVLHHYIKISWILTTRNRELYYTVFIRIIVELIKSGVNPYSKSVEGSSPVDLCTMRMRNCSCERCTLAMILFHRLGYMLPEDGRHVTRTLSRTRFPDLATELDQVPSLQWFCSKSIRCDKGKKTGEFMERQCYPQHLKDFVLLKNLDWHEFLKNICPVGQNPNVSLS